jgi:translation elongation factor EF-Ts
MKKLILLFIVATFISCDTKTLEINKEGGSWNAWDESGVSKKATIGSESDLEIAMAFYNAYGDMELDKMVDLSEDIVKFHPGNLAGVVDVNTSNTDFVAERQSTFESIKRTLHNVTPISTVGSENYTIVSINFTEEITYKDGSTSKDHYFERIHVSNGKVNRVVQWMRPSE